MIKEGENDGLSLRMPLALFPKDMPMHAEIVAKRGDVAALCQRYGVARLDVFGSAATGTDFDSERSDIDFLVAFQSDIEPTLDQFFGLEAALSDLFGREVDLVGSGAVRNPYVRASIERTREPVYGV